MSSFPKDAHFPLRPGPYETVHLLDSGASQPPEQLLHRDVGRASCEQSRYWQRLLYLCYMRRHHGRQGRLHARSRRLRICCCIFSQLWKDIWGIDRYGE